MIRPWLSSSGTARSLRDETTAARVIARWVSNIASMPGKEVKRSSAGRVAHCFEAWESVVMIKFQF
jgi:hypothetical protein